MNGTIDLYNEYCKHKKQVKKIEKKREKIISRDVREQWLVAKYIFTIIKEIVENKYFVELLNS